MDIQIQQPTVPTKQRLWDVDTDCQTDCESNVSTVYGSIGPGRSKTNFAITRYGLAEIDSHLQGHVGTTL